MRPDPIVRIDSAFFWEACERGEFVAQKCSACDILWHPPRPMCPKCHSTDKDVQQLSGLGKIMSWGMQVTPPAFGFETSPITALIELDEGLRFVATVEGVGEDDMQVGMRVKVDFADSVGGKKVPVFLPAKEG